MNEDEKELLRMEGEVRANETLLDALDFATGVAEHMCNPRCQRRNWAERMHHYAYLMRSAVTSHGQAYAILKELHEDDSFNLSDADTYPVPAGYSIFPKQTPTKE